MFDVKDEIYNISSWIKQYVNKSGSKGIVVGVSGGIDSAVVASLCVRAVGEENVLLVNIPCESSADAERDAIMLSKSLGIEPLVISCASSLYSMISMFKISNQKVSFLTKANIKARLRMTILYALAGENNYIVAGTGNKTEMSIGYFTKYGDGGVDIEPIGGFYKTEIYKIAEELPEIPHSILSKPPSADLWEGQTDESEIGMTYSELDLILWGLHNHCNTYDYGFSNIETVKQMIKKNEHKINMPPMYTREYLKMNLRNI